VDLYLSATAFEGAYFLNQDAEAFRFHGRRGLRGEGWTWLELGVGKVNAAMTLSAFLETEPGVRRVLLVGIAGAYPGTGLRPGDLVLASEEIQADLGTRRGMEPLGFPALVRSGRRYFNRFPAEPGYTGWLSKRLGLRPLPLVTADKVSESLAEAYERARAWRAAAENMEGAAVAQVAIWRGLPWAELRAISNPAGVREKAKWRTDEALTALGQALFRVTYA